VFDTPSFDSGTESDSHVLSLSAPLVTYQPFWPLEHPYLPSHPLLPTGTTTATTVSTLPSDFLPLTDGEFLVPPTLTTTAPLPHLPNIASCTTPARCDKLSVALFFTSFQQRILSVPLLTLHRIHREFFFLSSQQRYTHSIASNLFIVRLLIV
jgi:hypothetical protein